MSNARTLADFKPGTLGSLATKSAVGSSDITDGSVTPTDLSQPLTRETSQATTSGTYKDFPGIPSWVKRITVVFSGVSTAAGSIVCVQIGSGSVTNSGYVSTAGIVGTSTANTTSGSSNTAGFHLHSNSAASTWTGTMTLINTTGNTWVASHSVGNNGFTLVGLGGGSITLSGTLDRMRVTTAGGVDTFDAGAVNILYE